MWIAYSAIVRTPAALTARIAGVFLCFRRRRILRGGADGNLRAGFAIDIGDGESPERNEVDTGDQFSGEGGQELPMPAEKPCEETSDTNVEDVIRGKCSALEDRWEDGDLQDVGNDSHDHGDAQARTC